MKNNNSFVIWLLFYVLILGTVSYLVWDYQYKTSYESGFIQGFVDGNTSAYDDVFIQFYENGLMDGKDNGTILGYTSGNLTGFNLGYEFGYEFGFNRTYQPSFTDSYLFYYQESYEEGSFEGYDQGFVDGNVTGSIQGYSDGFYHSIDYDIRDPSLHEVEIFLGEQTPENVAEFKIKAFNRGFRCFWALINFPGDHYVDSIAFNTTDKGIIFYNLKEHQIEEYTIGRVFYDRSIYREPWFNDTIVGFEFIP